jgi:hypothetical protein
MDLYPGTAEDLMRILGHRKTTNDAEPWQRWDEELVEEFGCWVIHTENLTSIEQKSAPLSGIDLSQGSI